MVGVTQRFRRPALPGSALFHAVPARDDPAARREAGDRAAALLVRGGLAEGDAAVERIVRLAETEGLDTLAELWAGAPPDSLAGSLWRLYLLRTWVYADPARAAREFETGRAHTPVHEVVAGVVDPPGPNQVRLLVDEVLRGAATGGFADTLFRAAAFARVAASGRARLDLPDAERHASDLSAARLLTLAQQLEHAGRLELSGSLS